VLELLARLFPLMLAAASNPVVITLVVLLQTFGPGGNLYAWIDIGFGAVMLGAAVVTFLRHGGGGGASRLISRLGPLACVGLGAVMMATNTSAIAAYVPLLHEISNSGLARAERAAALAISDLVILAPLAVPILIRAMAPDRSARVLGAIRGFLDRYGTTIAAFVFAALGAFLVIRGIARL
jgi:hypothetical protein